MKCSSTWESRLIVLYKRLPHILTCWHLVRVLLSHSNKKTLCHLFFYTCMWRCLSDWWSPVLSGEFPWLQLLFRLFQCSLWSRLCHVIPSVCELDFLNANLNGHGNGFIAVISVTLLTVTELSMKISWRKNYSKSFTHQWSVEYQLSVTNNLLSYQCSAHPRIRTASVFLLCS